MQSKNLQLYLCVEVTAGPLLLTGVGSLCRLLNLHEGTNGRKQTDRQQLQYLAVMWLSEEILQDTACTSKKMARTQQIDPLLAHNQ